MGAVSAVDIALWDIKGKYFNVPVWQLLSGQCRNKVRVYAHISGRTVEEQIEHCLKAKEEGFTALGHINPFLDEPSSLPYTDGSSSMLYKAEERVGLIRDAVAALFSVWSCTGGGTRHWPFHCQVNWNNLIQCFWKTLSVLIILMPWPRWHPCQGFPLPPGSGYIIYLNFKCFWKEKRATM